MKKIDMENCANKKKHIFSHHMLHIYTIWYFIFIMQMEYPYYIYLYDQSMKSLIQKFVHMTAVSIRIAYLKGTTSFKLN